MLTNRKRAMMISSSKNFVRARVDSIKGQYGFISYETDESKKLFFHMSEVEGNTAVEPGKNRLRCCCCCCHQMESFLVVEPGKNRRRRCHRMESFLLVFDSFRFAISSSSSS